MKNVIMSIAICVFIGCGEAEAVSNKNIVNKVVRPESVVKNNAGSFSNYMPVKIVEMNLDNMTFREAFRIEHRAKGEGHTFWWNNEEYNNISCNTYVCVL